jgi:hypothetical protein
VNGALLRLRCENELAFKMIDRIAANPSMPAPLSGRARDIQ